jgi:hypothetical protein
MEVPLMRALITVVIGLGVTVGILAEANHVGVANGGALLVGLAGGGAAALAHRAWVRGGREMDRLVAEALRPRRAERDQREVPLATWTQGDR